MNRHAFHGGSVLLLLLCAVLPGCQSVKNVTGKIGDTITGVFKKKPSSGPARVDDLLARIERVHTECELSEQITREALATIESIASPDFDGDPMTAYQELVASIDRCERRAKDLDTAVRPMKRAAGPFFDRWAANLGDFTSMEIRLRSQARLEETHERYEAIVAAVEPAQSAFEAFNARLRDHMLFLGHDFNPAALHELQGEVRSLSEHAGELGHRFAAVRDAAQDYVAAAALPGQVEVARTENPQN